MKLFIKKLLLYFFNENSRKFKCLRALLGCTVNQMMFFPAPIISLCWHKMDKGACIPDGLHQQPQNLANILIENINYLFP